MPSHKLEKVNHLKNIIEVTLYYCTFSSLAAINDSIAFFILCTSTSGEVGTSCQPESIMVNRVNCGHREVWDPLTGLLMEI